MGLSFVEAPAAAMEPLGDEGWPLTHYLLHPPEAPDRPLWQPQRQAPDRADNDQARRDALEALIESAFGR